MLRTQLEASCATQKEPTFWQTWLPTLDLVPHEVESFCFG
ncbi:MAG: hypothetical protein FD138_519 [Planctomycetota bacterium]|nr:MAG: hypothetical protein FD138_519 [Planctomycetota bacterium]